MIEISIFCVIGLAAGYWVALWLMGRHDDVLHGDFVQTEQQPEPAPTHGLPLPLNRPNLPLGSSDSLQLLLR
jgi:hypothetical protein